MSMVSFRNALFSVVCIMAVSLASAPAQAQSFGPAALPGQNARCMKASPQILNEYPYHLLTGETTFAFAEQAGGASVCFQTYIPDEGEYTVENTAIVIAEIDTGQVLEQLSRPQLSNNRTTFCWHTGAGFDDFNNDGYSDILLMVMCDLGDGSQIYDNVPYITEVREGSLFTVQREDLKGVVVNYADYASAAVALRGALGTGPVPRPPSTPPPSASQAASDLQTCHYIEDGGSSVTLTLNSGTNTVSGTFGQGGTLSGIHKGTKTTGQWFQGDSRGEFEFNHETWGFWGYWKYSTDNTWREEWNANLVSCD